MRTLPTTLLQIFCEIILNSKFTLFTRDNTLRERYFCTKEWKRNGNHSSTDNSPPHILCIYASFLSYFQKYHRSRRHLTLALLFQITGEHEVSHPPVPEINPPNWRGFWLAKPVLRNFFVSGQVQSSHISTIVSAGEYKNLC